MIDEENNSNLILLLIRQVDPSGSSIIASACAAKEGRQSPYGRTRLLFGGWMSEGKPYAQHSERCGSARGLSSSQPTPTKVKRQDEVSC